MSEPQRDTPPMVVNKHSMMRPDGDGWDTCELVLPLGASYEMIKAALVQWGVARELALATMRNLNDRTEPGGSASYTAIDPADVKIYVEWLINNAREPAARTAAAAVAGAMITKAPQPPELPPDEPGEDIPF